MCNLLPGGLECSAALEQGTCPSLQKKCDCAGNEKKPDADKKRAQALLHLAIDAGEDGHGHLSDGKVFRRSPVPLQLLVG